MLVHVQRQIGVLAAQEDIQSKVKEQIGDRQREMLLREQLRAIQKELGEGEGKDAADLEELKKKLAAHPLSEDARKEVDRELSRLERIGRESMESQVIRTFLETVAELPWGARSDEKLDVNEASRVLDEDHYALTDVKDRILEFLAVRQMRASDQGRAAPARAASSSSSALRASARPPSRSPSRARWAASTCASRSAGRATRPTSAATGGRTSARCRAASCRG